MKFPDVTNFSDSGDPKPSPGRKFRRESESDHENLPKWWKIEKYWKTWKTPENLRIHRFFDLQNEFSFCWRSKSHIYAPGLRAPPRFWFATSAEKEHIFDIKTNVGADFDTDTTSDTGTVSDADTNNDSDFDFGGAVWLGPAQSTWGRMLGLMLEVMVGLMLGLMLRLMLCLCWTYPLPCCTYAGLMFGLTSDSSLETYSWDLISDFSRTHIWAYVELSLGFMLDFCLCLCWIYAWTYVWCHAWIYAGLLLGLMLGLCLDLCWTYAWTYAWPNAGPCPGTNEHPRRDPELRVRQNWKKISFLQF